MRPLEKTDRDKNCASWKPLTDEEEEPVFNKTENAYKKKWNLAKNIHVKNAVKYDGSLTPPYLWSLDDLVW